MSCLRFQSCVTALDQTWHPDHFVCTECGKAFGDNGFHERDGKPYCREDYYAMFAPRCGGCGKPIMDNYISALSAHWHQECFICTVSVLICFVVIFMLLDVYSSSKARNIGAVLGKHFSIPLCS